MLGQGGCGREVCEGFSNSFSGGINPGHDVLRIFDPGDHPFLVVDLDPDGPAFDDRRLVPFGGPGPVCAALCHATFVINLSSKIKESQKSQQKMVEAAGIEPAS